jgi:hypothetical protein
MPVYPGARRIVADVSLCMPLGAQVGQKNGTAVLRQTDRLRAMRLIDSWGSLRR